MAIPVTESEILLTANDQTGRGFKSAQKNLQNLASSAAILEGPLGAVAGRINALGAALGRTNPLFIAGGVAFASLTVAAVSGTKAFSEWEQQMFRITEQLRITGFVSGKTAAEIDLISEALGRNTLASQEGARDAASALLRFTSVQGESFERVLKIGQDITSIFGGSLIANVRKVARAIEDPERGLQQLGRELITVNDLWEDNVQRMSDAGDVAGVTNAILGELERTMGGAGTAEAGGVAGGIDSMGEAWTRMIRVFERSEQVNVATARITKLLDVVTEAARESTGVERLAEIIEKVNELENFTGSFGLGVSALEQRGIQQKIDSLLEEIPLILQKIALDEESLFQKRELAKASQEQLRLDKIAATAAIKAAEDKKVADKAALKAAKLAEREKTKAIANADKASKASLNPLDALTAAYAKNAIALSIAIDKQIGDVERYEDALVSLNARFNEDVAGLDLKDAKVTNKADRIRESLLGEEAEVEASYIRRASIVSDASAKIGADELDALARLQDTMRLLTEEFASDTAEIRAGVLDSREARIVRVADALRASLQNEEAQIDASYNARALIVAEATAVIADSEIQKKLELQDTLRLLTIQHERDIASIRISQAQEGLALLGGVLGAQARLVSSQSRQQTNALNSEYQERANIINESVNSGVITRERGDKRLEQLESQRQTALEVNARKQFERKKKVDLQQAKLSAAVAIIGAVADTNGGYFARAAAGAATAALGLAQISAIQGTTYGGGGSVKAPSGSAPAAPVQQQQQQQQAPSINGRLTVVGNDNTSFSVPQLIKLAEQLHKITGELDIQLVDPSSRNARDIRDSSNDLVI